MALFTNTQKRLAKSGSELLYYPDLRAARTKDFTSGENVVFIHGFTADCGHLVTLMDRFVGEGFTCFAFNYPCFDGIDIAARELHALLSQLDALSVGCISGRPVTLVCHSMGGLVGRFLANLASADNFVRKIVTLGTPHDGALRESELIDYLLDLAQATSRWRKVWAPPSDASKRRSALQLLGKDEERLLERMQRIGAPSNISFYSVSGGHPWIEFGANHARNVLANLYIQSLMRDKPNDGLVLEESSDLSPPKFSGCAPLAKHQNSYTSFTRTNHSALTENQEVANLSMLATRAATS